MGIGLKILFSIMILAVFYGLCYMCVHKCCKNQKRDQYLEDLLEYIRAAKDLERNREKGVTEE